MLLYRRVILDPGDILILCGSCNIFLADELHTFDCYERLRNWSRRGEVGRALKDEHEDI